MMTLTLTGSEKQIKWATEIRERAIAYHEAHGTPEWGRNAATELAAVLPLLTRQTSASWWIENQWVATTQAAEVLRKLVGDQGTTWRGLNRGKVAGFVAE